MKTDNKTLLEDSLAADTVMSCVIAVNNGDYANARTYVSDNMSFIGVLGATEGGDVYIDYLDKKQIKYEVHKAFANGDDVCLLYDLLMDGLSIYGCGWYHVKDGKISMVKVVFDPRPMLERKA